MRTIVDIPEEDLQFLADLCEREKISRAEAVRRAVRFYRHREQADSKEALQAALNSTFGLWKDRQIDPLEKHRSIRAEWDDRGWDEAP